MASTSKRKASATPPGQTRRELLAEVLEARAANAALVQALSRVMDGDEPQPYDALQQARTLLNQQHPGQYFLNRIDSLREEARQEKAAALHWQREAEEVLRANERLGDDLDQLQAKADRADLQRRDVQAAYARLAIFEGQVHTLTDLCTRLQHGIEQRNEAYTPYLVEHGRLYDYRGGLPDEHGVFHCPCAACMTAEALRSQSFAIVPDQQQQPQGEHPAA